MTSSLKSRRNFIIIIIILTFFLITFLFQIIASYALNKLKPKIIKQLNDIFEYTFALDNASFNLIRGIHLKGFYISYDRNDKPSVALKDAYVSIELMPVFFKKIVIRKININEVSLLLKKDKGGFNLQIMFNDIYKKIFQMPPWPYKIIISKPSISAGSINLIYDDMRLILSRGRFSASKAGRVKFTSDIKFIYQLPKTNFLSGFLKKRDIMQPLKCTMEGTIYNKDLNIDMLLLSLAKEQIIGIGAVKNFTESQPYVNISFIPSTISLSNIAFLQNNFSSDGYLLFDLKFMGNLDNIKPALTMRLDNCNFRYSAPNGEIFYVRNMRGQLEFRDKIIRLKDAYLKLNNLPLNINLETKVSDGPDIFLNASLPKDFLQTQNVSIENLEFSLTGKIKDTLKGDLQVKTLYKRQDTDFKMQADFKNIDLDYRNLKGRYLMAKRIELVKSDPSVTQKLYFSDFNSKLSTSKDYFHIEDINFNGYNGVLKGYLNVDLRKKALLYIALKGKGLDLKPLVEDIKVMDELSDGKLDIKVVFNNHLKDFLFGTCHVKSGIADLDKLGDIVNFPSLKNTHFDTMHFYFGISKQILKLRGIRLDSPDIILNAYWEMNKKMSGVFNMKISSQLLKESSQFRKLLSLAKIREPYIDFKFLLGGIPKAKRFMWMKDEFKEKLEISLSQGIKKAIEANLNKTIEELSKK